VNCPSWNPELEVEALAAHEGLADRGELSRPQAEPITVASVWQMESPEVADQALGKSLEAFVYRRDGHPNDASLAHKLAKLHAAEGAVLTAQGMSAIAAVAISTLAPGKSIWLGEELYGKSHRLCQRFLAPWGSQVRLFDPTHPRDLDSLQKASVAMVLVETLSNPRLKVADLAALAQSTHAAGGILVVDNTFATHLLCQPLKLGADVVVESLSKQVNGHSDSMLGMVAIKQGEMVGRIQDAVSTFGMASSPLDCYLTQRGLLSLGVRMERACLNAAKLAEALSSRVGQELTDIDYPGLERHPQHALATKQLRGGYGWMLTLHLDLSRVDLHKFFARLRPEIPFVPSLGDTSTTVTHPISTSHRGLSADERRRLGIDHGTVRVSCGLEPTDWLVDRFMTGIST
jgi:cystathionine beta-lyase/cystathionine gamma-synthase